MEHRVFKNILAEAPREAGAGAAAAGSCVNSGCRRGSRVHPKIFMCFRPGLPLLPSNNMACITTFLWESLISSHNSFFFPPPRSPYGYKWDQGGEHYTLSNGLPCIWKAKPRGLYNQANMQTNWNYNGTLEYIPEVFKPQRRKKNPLH